MHETGCAASFRRLRRNTLAAPCCALLLCFQTFTATAHAQNEEEQYATAGQKALAAGQYDVARTNFEKLAKLDPQIAEVHATLGVIDFKLRDYEHAVSEVRRAKALKPGLPRLNSLLGLNAEG